MNQIKNVCVLSSLLDSMKEEARIKRMAKQPLVVQVNTSGRVAPVSMEARVDSTKLHMANTRKGKALKAEPSKEAKQLSKDLVEQAYLQWVEAHSTRREIEKSFAQQFNPNQNKEMVEALAGIVEDLQGTRMHTEYSWKDMLGFEFKAGK